VVGEISASNRPRCGVQGTSKKDIVEMRYVAGQLRRSARTDRLHDRARTGIYPPGLKDRGDRRGDLGFGDDPAQDIYQAKRWPYLNAGSWRAALRATDEIGV
jgi:hypothetical protein